jgi:hypothetical protein
MAIATRTMTSLPLSPLLVTTMTQARAGARAHAIAVAICLGCSQWNRCHPRCRQWHQGRQPPTWPCHPCPHPPCRGSPLPSFPGCHSPLRRMCQGPPHRPSLQADISANCGCNSALAPLCSALARCHCSHYCLECWGARAMPLPWQACAGRWSS